jgi:hypothetical protein
MGQVKRTMARPVSRDDPQDLGGKPPIVCLRCTREGRDWDGSGM